MTARRRRGEDRAQARSGPGLATADDCDDGGEVSRVELHCPKHPKVLITLAHSLTASHTRSDAGFAVESELGRAVLSRSLRYPRVVRTGGRARRGWFVFVRETWFVWHVISFEEPICTIVLKRPRCDIKRGNMMY